MYSGQSNRPSIASTEACAPFQALLKAANTTVTTLSYDGNGQLACRETTCGAKVTTEVYAGGRLKQIVTVSPEQNETFSIEDDGSTKQERATNTLYECDVTFPDGRRYTRTVDKLTGVTTNTEVDPTKGSSLTIESPSARVEIKCDRYGELVSMVSRD